LKVLLEAGNGLVKIELLEDKNDILISLDRSKILSVGLPAVSEFLVKFQVYKATADEANAKQLYDKYTQFQTKEEEKKWLLLRKIVLDKRQPRKVFVQPNTFITRESGVSFKEYSASSEGLLLSFLDRKL
jgi:dipeptidyl-peptidase-3